MSTQPYFKAGGPGKVWGTRPLVAGWMVPGVLAGLQRTLFLLWLDDATKVRNYR